MQHTPIPLGIDKEQFTLWGNTLIRSSNAFDISYPTTQNASPSSFDISQEDTMCAMGAAVFLGVGNPQDYELTDAQTGLTTYESGGWNEYTLNVFGSKKLNDVNDIGNRMGYWVASQEWARVDNTAEGAGKRLLYMLENGVPDWGSIASMTLGHIPLCYLGVGLELSKKPKVDLSLMFDIDGVVKSKELTEA